ncbi:ribonuclease HII [Pedobacter psychrophilus]|uniref:Ribonuclease HII n=1 Tax=Pedobacter psychrophilus TaxID=1826909 RepID=A0A179DCP7_9SPHI|nr:ribonuclease HII [Pedobacter psychrophilus]OAQ38815.1 ribonuclease HII [Pedobacter psychrophilus]
MLLSYFQNQLIEAGCDEAGRGCLAGPVFAAAVILPQDFHHPLLNDSKQIKESDRFKLRVEIEKNAIAFAVAMVDHQEIDKINILNASFLAMHRAVEKLKVQPQFLIIDGNRFKTYPNINHECIVKGDGKYFSIAAASILAKTYRDDFMHQIDEEFPVYQWKKNKGYPTQHHRQTVIEIGFSPYHRKTFRVTNPQLSIF